jgi:hypothetical protein
MMVCDVKPDEKMAALTVGPRDAAAAFHVRAPRALLPAPYPDPFDCRWTAKAQYMRSLRAALTNLECPEEPRCADLLAVLSADLTSEEKQSIRDFIGAELPVGMLRPFVSDRPVVVSLPRLGVNPPAASLGLRPEDKEMHVVVTRVARDLFKAVLLHRKHGDISFIAPSGYGKSANLALVASALRLVPNARVLHLQDANTLYRAGADNARIAAFNELMWTLVTCELPNEAGVDELAARLEERYLPTREWFDTRLLRRREGQFRLWLFSENDDLLYDSSARSYRLFSPDLNSVVVKALSPDYYLRVGSSYYQRLKQFKGGLQTLDESEIRALALARGYRIDEWGPDVPQRILHRTSGVPSLVVELLCAQGETLEEKIDRFERAAIRNVLAVIHNERLNELAEAIAQISELHVDSKLHCKESSSKRLFMSPIAKRTVGRAIAWLRPLPSASRFSSRGGSSALREIVQFLFEYSLCVVVPLYSTHRSKSQERVGEFRFARNWRVASRFDGLGVPHRPWRGHERRAVLIPNAPRHPFADVILVDYEDAKLECKVWAICVVDSEVEREEMEWRELSKPRQATLVKGRRASSQGTVAHDWLRFVSASPYVRAGTKLTMKPLWVVSEEWHSTRQRCFFNDLSAYCTFLLHDDSL